VAVQKLLLQDHRGVPALEAEVDQVVAAAAMEVVAVAAEAAAALAVEEAAVRARPANSSMVDRDLRTAPSRQG
jgi:hypothetical protein